MTWRVLMDTRSPWFVEFSMALDATVEARVYSPEIGVLGRVRRSGCREAAWNELRVWRFPLQRGYFSPYVSPLLLEDGRILRWLGESEASKDDPLICCLPHYARIAKRWPGPVVYYTMDLYRAYKGWDPAHIAQLERRMCHTATLVCPNSTRIAEVLATDARCAREKIVVVPNAVRAENLLPTPALQPAALPGNLAGLQRPVAGVIGNLGENTDWLLLERVVHDAPWLSWAFVGPYTAAIVDVEHAGARQRLLQAGGRIRFTGMKDSGELKLYARALDVAILPYRKREPTYSGSSTRFYEHLAACRPMIATRGFEELLHKEPLLRLANTSEECVVVLEALRKAGFRDGLEELRWRVSLENTWEARARQMSRALEERTRQAGAAEVLQAHE